MTDTDNKVTDRMAQHREHTETLRALERITARAEKAEAERDALMPSPLVREVRAHASRRGPLDGADAQALEAALTLTERERDEALRLWDEQRIAASIARCDLAVERARADAAEQMVAEMRGVVREAQSWILPKNLDPDHPHYDLRAVGFNDRCDAALARTEAVAGRWVLATEVTAAFDRKSVRSFTVTTQQLAEAKYRP